MKLTRQNLTLAFVAILAVACTATFAGYPVTAYLPPEVLAALGAAGAMPMAIGETSLLEIKTLVEKQGTTWEDYKKTNDERIAKLAKGESVAEIEQKLAKMDLALTEAGKELKEIALKANRPAVSGDNSEKAAKELERFNAKAKAAAIEGGKSFTPMDAEHYAAYKAAIDAHIRYGEKGMTPDQLKAINVGTSSQGGFLVGEEMESGIDRVVHRYSGMRQIARVRPLGQATYKKLVKISGTSGGKRGGENTTPTDGTSPRWAELEFKPGTYVSEQRLTSEALEDIVQDIGGDLEEEIGIEFAEMEGYDVIFGDGLNGARGLLAYDIVPNANYEWGKLGYVKTGGAAGFAAATPSDALIDLQHSLKRQYRGNAVWNMNDATLGVIRKFKDGNGIYLWAPSNLMQGAVGQLLGHGVNTDDFMPDLGANASPVAFGDFQRGYVIVDRKGVSILRDPATAFPAVRFLARRRTGGGVQNFEAIKLLKCEA